MEVEGWDGLAFNSGQDMTVDAIQEVLLAMSELPERCLMLTDEEEP